MPGVARNGDTHSGTCHGNSVSGTIISTNPVVTADGRSVALLGDEVIYECEEPGCSQRGVITSASSITRVGGHGVARTGDSVEYDDGSGTITSGSSSVSSN